MKLTTPVCDYDKNLPKFALAATDNQQYSSSDLITKNGLLVMFICNHCPFVRSILADLVTACKELKDSGVGVVAISSNDWHQYPDDSPANMAKLSSENNFSFPYLIDESQQVAKAFGAVCTPDFFGFNAQGKLQYRGNFKNLLEAMLLISKTGKGPTEQTASIGCSIKWKD